MFRSKRPTNDEPFTAYSSNFLWAETIESQSHDRLSCLNKKPDKNKNILSSFAWEFPSSRSSSSLAFFFQYLASHRHRLSFLSIDHSETFSNLTIFTGIDGASPREATCTLFPRTMTTMMCNKYSRVVNSWSHLYPARVQPHEQVQCQHYCQFNWHNRIDFI